MTIFKKQPKEGQPEQAPKSEEEPNFFSAVALDLDGTALNSRGKLSSTTIQELRRLDAKGFTIMLATGRPIGSTYEPIRDLNLPHPIPVVCSNGAQGMLCWPTTTDDNKDTGVVNIDKEELFSMPVPNHVVQRTLELADKHSFVVQCYIDDKIYADPKGPQHFLLANKYFALTGKKPIFHSNTPEKDQPFLTTIMQKHNGRLPSKLLVLCRTDQQKNMMKVLDKGLTKDSAYHIKGKPPVVSKGQHGWFAEILCPHVHKGNGLAQMLKHLDIPIKQCLAFGDGNNDYEFLYLAGRGYAMKNGSKLAKHIANETIAYDNDSDGVVRTLLELEKEGTLIFRDNNITNKNSSSGEEKVKSNQAGDDVLANKETDTTASTVDSTEGEALELQSEREKKNAIRVFS